MTVFSFALLGQPISAQEWPNRPVTMVVPFAAGGPVDLQGRILAQRVSEILRQRIIVENVTGAGGVIGTERVAKATADGYQFVFGGVSTMAFSQAIYAKPPYNAVTDFAPVILVTEQPLVLITRTKFPAGDLNGFIAYTKQHAAEMRFGSGGIGSAAHLGCALLNATIGIATTHVPYRGSEPAMPDLMAGRIDYFCDAVSTAFPHILAGELKAMAVLGPTRSAILAEVATADEQGLRGFDVSVWNASFLPANTPKYIVRGLHDAISIALDTPAVRDQLTSTGVSIVPPQRRSSAYLAEYLKSEIEKWAAVIKLNRITAN